jgi:hypothetical protein
MGVAAVDERIRARVCWCCVWRRNGLRQQCRLLGRFYGGQTMQDREKLQSRRGLVFCCSQADTQQQGCYASKV